MEQPKVLLVDDLEENLVALQALLRTEPVRIFRARSGAEALELFLVHDFALALLDVQMPEMNGFELAELARGTERTRSVPIIFVTAADRDQNRMFRGYDSGAVDFLYKPLDPHMVRSKVRVFVELDLQRRQLHQQIAENELRTREARRLFEDLERAMQRLENEQAMREKFLAMIAHDLRTPLTASRVSAQLLARPGTGAEDVQRLGAKIRDGMDRADRMIQDLLDVHRAQAGKVISMELAPFNLTELARETIEDLTTIYGDRFRLAAPEKVDGCWSATGLRRILENLASNAVKYGSDREPVRVAVKELGDDRVLLTVHNSGAPILEQEQDTLFKQFERASAAVTSGKKGWGIGLTLVKGITESHGGQVTVRSSAAEGTTFSVILPRDARGRAAA